MTPSTTNTAARELLASALDECGRPTDAAEVREGRNPFVRGEYALAAIEKSLPQQQGGEQEAGECDTDEEMKDMALASIRALVSPLQYSAICEVFREHAALRSKQPAASEGDGPSPLDYDREAIIRMLEDYDARPFGAAYKTNLVREQIDKLRHATNTSKQAAGEAVAYAEAEYEFEVWQDDFVQAGGTAPTVEEVMTEAGHYAMMYGQDGPVRVRYYERREFKPIDAAIQAGTP